MDRNLEAKMAHEIEMCEVIRQHPHPNLAVFHGCVIKEKRVSGLVFEKYPLSLLEIVNPGGISKNNIIVSPRIHVSAHMRDWLKCLHGAVEHLHSLGYIHNDLTPANIMIADSENPVIIDFGSLCRVGESLAIVKRTPDWHDQSVMQAAADNDLGAVEEIENWLFGSASDVEFSW